MPRIIENQRVWLNGYDFTCRSTSLAESAETAELDVTTLCAGGTRINEPGLKGWGFAGEGLWEGGTGEIDDALHGELGVRDVPFTVAYEDGSAGSPARSVQAMVGSLDFGGSVGEVLPIAYKLSAMDSPVRGTVLHNGTVSGNVTGTAFDLGEVAEETNLYGILHVFGGTGDLTVKIRSAVNSAFDSAPTDRITFTTVGTATARASQWAIPIPGPIGQGWWRVEATNPNSRNFAVVMATAVVTVTQYGVIDSGAYLSLTQQATAYPVVDSGTYLSLASTGTAVFRFGSVDGSTIYLRGL